MTTFKTVRKRAISRKGGSRALSDLLPHPDTPARLRKIPDDRWLAAMTRTVFQAGFNSAAVTRRWGNFEQAFAGFDPMRWADMSSRDRQRLLRDSNIVRNPQKIDAVKLNAQFLLTLSEEHGSAARAFAAWPSAEHNELLLSLREHAGRLGGLSGQVFLRSMGKDSYILTPDVLHALNEKRVKAAGTSQSARSLKAIQDQFNAWQLETDLPLCQLSKILACSAGYNHSPAEMARWTTVD